MARLFKRAKQILTLLTSLSILRLSLPRDCPQTPDTTLSIPPSYHHTLPVSLRNPRSVSLKQYLYIHNISDTTHNTIWTMEIYTTSFTYPRRSRLSHSPASSLDFSTPSDLRHQDSYSQLQQQQQLPSLADSQATASPTDYDAVQKLVMMAMAIHAVHVSFAPADQGKAWNFQISGVYQQVMLARGMIMKECPVQVCKSSTPTRVPSPTSRLFGFSPPNRTAPLSRSQGPTFSILQLQSQA